MDDQSVNPRRREGSNQRLSLMSGGWQKLFGSEYGATKPTCCPDDATVPRPYLEAKPHFGIPTATIW
jgi:hypothetical protein